MFRKRLTLTLCILLAACLPQNQGTASSPRAWFDMPLPNTVFSLPDSCQIIAHGASPNGVAIFELLINGAIASSIPASDSKQSLSTLNAACPPLMPGINSIEIRVKDNSGAWSDTAQTTVFLASEDGSSEVAVTGTPAPLNPTFTPIPTLTPVLISTTTPQPAGSVIVERISTSLVFIGNTNCGPTDISFTIRATAPNGIAAVLLLVRFQTGNASTEFLSEAMTSMGGDRYERTINPTSVLGGVIPFDSATLEYQIVVQQTDGDVSIRTPVLSDITVQACGVAASACSQYTDERTCIANSCTWGPIPDTRTIGCQNP